MADKNGFKILGFNKREAEVLIMSLQVLRHSPASTNSCTASPTDLVRIGAFERTETARSQFAALRARVMALPNLPKPASKNQRAANDRDDDDDDDDDHDDEDENYGAQKPSPFLTTRKGMKGATIRLGTSEDYKKQPNPFLLTEEECKRAAAQAGVQPPTLPPSQPAARHSARLATQPADQPGAGSKDDEDERPARKSKFGEGALDEDMPTVDEWEAMGDDKAI